MCTFKLPSGLKSVIFHVSVILILKLKKLCALNLYINNMDSVVLWLKGAKLPFKPHWQTLSWSVQQRRPQNIIK